MRLVSDASLAIITIWQEARGESFQGKCAVAEVIRNRMARKYNSDGTMAGTVCRAYQFSGWNAGEPNRIPSLQIDDNDSVVMECAKAWRTSTETTYARGAVLYCNLSTLPTRPAWAIDKAHVAKVGSHDFFID